MKGPATRKRGQGVHSNYADILADLAVKLQEVTRLHAAGAVRERPWRGKFGELSRSRRNVKLARSRNAA